MLDVEALARDGLARVPGLLDARALAALRAEEARLRAVLPPTAAGPLRGWVVHDLARHSAPVRELAMRGPHVDALERVLGPDFGLRTSIMLTKKAGGDPAIVEYPWHQDGVVNEGDAVVALWIALDDVHERNGCVWALPESHREGYLPHERVRATTARGVAVELAAGDAVLLHGHVLHRSFQNASEGLRRAINLGYVSLRATSAATGERECARPEVWMVRGAVPLPSRDHHHDDDA